MTPPDLLIRPLEGNAEYRACVALQRLTWGEGFSEEVPPAILMAAQEVGGVTSGAFDGDRLVGFVFGITGVRDGRPVHWSDMLAVHPDYRRQGLGVQLKLHQREVLLERGVETVLWTFDPLEAGNARLNLSRLGAIARTYRRDLYGDTGSALHAGIGTDRLIAEWPIASERVRRRLAGADSSPDREEAAALPPLDSADRPGDAPRVRVPVPADIQTLKARDPDVAREWRMKVRAGLETAFSAGYTAVEVVPMAEGRSAYLLERGFSA